MGWKPLRCDDPGREDARDGWLGADEEDSGLEQPLSNDFSNGPRYNRQCGCRDKGWSV